jgi:nicotinamidase-related amidase
VLGRRSLRWRLTAGRRPWRKKEKRVLLDRKESFLLIVDVQEKLAPAVLQSGRVVANAARLLAAAERLEVPAFMTEHCADKIGPVLPALRDLVPGDAILPKVHFAAVREPACAERFSELGRPVCVIAGMETHVCVLQSAISLKEAGYHPHVVADAVSSRHALDRDTALARLRDSGVGLVTTEMVIFEWLGRGDDAAFRDLLPVIKGAAAAPADAP